jgi:murein DD-endopeptidase MepM/ murein hydrolase activator NlpD
MPVRGREHPLSDQPSQRSVLIVGGLLGAMGVASIAFFFRALALDSAGVAREELARPATAPSPVVQVKAVEKEVQGAFYVGSEGQGGMQAGILDAVDDALSGNLPADGLKPGSAVRVLALEEDAGEQFVRYKSVAAVEVRPPGSKARPIRIYSFTGQQARGYFDEAGKQPAEAGWQSPVPGALRTSKFNPTRMHPILHRIMPHNGTDFGAMTGTPIYAAWRGVIDWVGPHGATGNWISILHPGGIETGYAHLSRFVPGLKHGDQVRTHQLIGYVGTTGRSTGPHLHLSARKDGVFFDAETLLAKGEREVPLLDRAAFLAAKADLDRRLDAVPLPAASAPAAVAKAGSSTAALPGSSTLPARPAERDQRAQRPQR